MQPEHGYRRELSQRNHSFYGNAAMNASSAASHAAPRYQGDNKLVLGIVLAVVTFWLFAQTTLNIAPAMRDDLRIAESINNIAVSITALFSGIFIVIAGGLADRLGRVKLTNIGIVLGILGSLLIALSPVGTATFLMIGRVFRECRQPASCRRRSP